MVLVVEAILDFTPETKLEARWAEPVSLTCHFVSGQNEKSL